MPEPKSFTPAQRQAVIELLWDSLHKDMEHKDRRQTGWGTKTVAGLVSTIERIAYDTTRELPNEKRG